MSANYNAAPCSVTQDEIIIDDNWQYVPTSLDDATRYIIELGLPSIAVYAGHPERQTLAGELASQTYQAGQPLLVAVEAHFAAENSPAALQDLQHERARAMWRAERMILARQGKAVKRVANTLVLATVGTGTGQYSSRLHSVEMGRSLG